jgi:hypothetical protein
VAPVRVAIDQLGHHLDAHPADRDVVALRVVGRNSQACRTFEQVSACELCTQRDHELCGGQPDAKEAVRHMLCGRTNVPGQLRCGPLRAVG